ncbi:nucleoside hydrolase [Holdemania filiformis]|uniref:nucleoside hydrolase n=1 Tax=Holdemania filiformis TaxID=61171 RepID=UPI003A8D03D9
MKIILDLDTGIDDALALSYALGDPMAEVIGVTCTYGNVFREQALENTETLLKALGRTDIPIYAGPAHPLTQTDFAPTAMCRVVHGEQGFGQAQIEPDPDLVQPQPAVEFILEAARRHGSELTLLTAGPLTTLAEVLRRNPNFKNEIGRVVCMAGVLTVAGNETPFAEANVRVDPEAAAEVFASGLPLVLVGLDVTLKTLYDQAHIDHLRALKTPAADLVGGLMQFYLDYYKTDQRRLAGCPLHDPLAAAAALHPDLMATMPVNLKVELEEAAGRGRTVADLTRLNDPQKDHQMAIDADVPRFLELFTHALERSLGNRSSAR